MTYLIWLLIGLMLVVLYLLYIRLIDVISFAPTYFKHRSWLKVNAEITDISLGKMGTRGGITALIFPHLYIVNYTYTCNGKTYTGKDSLSAEPVKEKGLTLFVNPKNIEESLICKFKRQKRR
ncbi:MAG: hypothetical protein LBM71_02420 [Elusimicrobiota bacterium]|jgi:hypothetical protein|nr:hypothetical protein [Elusimicrobiota bacterium]